MVFEIGDFVYLKVSPMKGVKRFHTKGKLSPRYVGPFKIINRRGEVAYQLELPEQLSGVHDVFHVSQLKKCLRVPEEQLPLVELDIQENLSYKEYLVRILEIAKRITRSRIIRMCKVQWNRHSVDEATYKREDDPKSNYLATWEREDDLKSDYPNLFKLSESRG